jgi:hypothetical protein
VLHSAEPAPVPAAQAPLVQATRTPKLPPIRSYLPRESPIPSATLPGPKALPATRLPEPSPPPSLSSTAKYGPCPLDAPPSPNVAPTPSFRPHFFSKLSSNFVV